ncbi:MAG: SDR family oxidoreductase [Gammaproteobacteria bacterium]|nr:SDR family oxidoreductase [Gammaproteobacteria bacterium]
MGKLGKTKDIAYIVQFIISNKSAYITGETLNANGGLFMK